MRAWMCVALTAACGAEPVDPLPDTARCQIEEVPELPDVPSDLPSIGPEDTPLDDLAWSEPFAPDPRDPTSDDFDPRGLWPEDAQDLAGPFRFADPPADLRDTSGALRLEKREDGGPWQLWKMFRMDDQGRTVATWNGDADQASHLRLFAYDEGVVTTRSLQLAGEAVVDREEFISVTHETWTFDVARSRPVDATDPETSWGRSEHMLRRSSGESPWLNDVHLEVIRSGDDEVRSIGWTRWLPPDAQGHTWGVEVFVDEGRLASSRAVVRLADGSVAAFLRGGQRTLRKVCPPVDEDGPRETLDVLYTNYGPMVDLTRTWPDGRSETLEDLDADGSALLRRTVRFEDEGRVRIEELEWLGDESPTVVWSDRAVYSDGGTLLERRTEVDEGDGPRVTETRSIPVD